MSRDRNNDQQRRAKAAMDRERATQERQRADRSPGAHRQNPRPLDPLPTDRRRRRICVPGRLLTDDTIDEVAQDIAAALRRDRDSARS